MVSFEDQAFIPFTAHLPSSVNSNIKAEPTKTLMNTPNLFAGVFPPISKRRRLLGPRNIWELLYSRTRKISLTERKGHILFARNHSMEVNSMLTKCTCLWRLQTCLPCKLCIVSSFFAGYSMKPDFESDLLLLFGLATFIEILLITVEHEHVRKHSACVCHSVITLLAPRWM